MIADLRDDVPAYLALAAMELKTFLIYHWSAVIFSLQSLLGAVVFVYFWRAIYANTVTIAGLTLTATLSYILLARIFQPLGNFRMIGVIGYHLHTGGIAHLHVRPLDMQLAFYAECLGTLAVALGRQAPVLLLAVLFFDLRLPTDPAVWGIFGLSALLGYTVLFFVDFSLACIAFYTTSTWGLSYTLSVLTTFVGGALVPLNMLPDWLRLILQSLPFAQAVYVPIALLSGVIPMSEAPRLLLTQLAWLAGMALLARLVFTTALRRITVQGG